MADPNEQTAVLLRHIELAYRLLKITQEHNGPHHHTTHTLRRVIAQLETELTQLPDPSSPTPTP